MNSREETVVDQRMRGSKLILRSILNVVSSGFICRCVQTRELMKDDDRRSGELLLMESPIHVLNAM